MIWASSTDPYFFTDEMPSGYSFNPCYVFNSKTYLDINGSPDICFYLANARLNKVVGLAYFYRQGNSLLSPLKASFGGFDLSLEDNSAKEEFVNFVCERLNTEPSHSIWIRLFASAYNENDSDLIQGILENHGFNIIRQEPNHHIPVDSIGFQDKIHEMERRKLRKLTQSGYVFKEELPPAISRIYEFIEKCRAERGHKLSLSQHEILHTSSSMPGLFRLFSVIDKDEIIAASICIVINEEILYNFYPASSLERNKESPMVYLNSRIYEFCQNHGYSFFDLGTSWIDDGPNESLIKFKENIGGLLSYRNTFEKVLK